jgi:prolipoprotein diacylglyceryl transferase
MTSIALWAVPAGLIGARLYHVITDNEIYRGHWFDNPFSSETSPWAVWKGGLGIPGGIVAGVGVGVIIAYRKGIRLPTGLDVIAPAFPLGQAIGRFGNYFNNEIHGAPTDLPWGLKVYEWDQAAGHAVLGPDGNPVVLGVFHPTFLYEAIFCLLLAGLLIWLDRRHDFRRGQIFALYVAGYPIGRGVIEFMRTDDANHILGLRVNSWVSILVFLLGVFLYVWFGRRPVDDDEPAPDSDPEEPAVTAESQHSE